jgi:hypothetical protein
MATSTQKKGGLSGFLAPSEQELRQAHRAGELEKLSQRFEQLGALRSVGRGLYASQDGRLWQHDPSLEGQNPERNAFTVGPDLEAIWL